MNFLKITISTLAIASTLAVPLAEARINTTRLSCIKAKNVVQSHGTIVLSTGRYTYDRYVANHSYCETGDIAVRAYVRTRDRESCSIGFTCQPYEGHGGYGKGRGG